MLYIGNHTSSSRGYLAMGKQMLANGGNTFAFFTRNPRGGKAKDIDPQDVQAFGQLAEENHFGKLVAHAPYVQGWICGRRIFIVDNDAKKSNG